LTAEAEALQARLRYDAACTRCVEQHRGLGRLVLDSAGHGEMKKRRFKCNRCKATLSVTQYLAVYSGQRAPIGQAQSDASPPMILSEAMPPVEQQPLHEGAYRQASDAQAHGSLRRTRPPLIGQHLHTTMTTTATTAGIQPGIQLTTAARPDETFDFDGRKAKIEATLDRLGLKGLNRKRRRLALEVLTPKGTPTPDNMMRVAFPCGDVDTASAIEAVRGLKLDPRSILHVLKMDNGIELLVPSCEIATVLAKAQALGLETCLPKLTIPTMRKECDSLLKAIKPAERNARHEHTRAYFAQWAQTILQNLPAHIKATRASAPVGTDSQNPVPQPCEVFDPFDHIPMDEILGDEGATNLEPRNMPARDTVSPSSNSDSQSEFTPSINDASMCMVSSASIDIMAQSKVPREQVIAECQFTVAYINAHGLDSVKLAKLHGYLKPNMILFVAETWHINDATIRTHPNIMALSPEPYRSLVSRGKGGLVLLAHETVRNDIKVISVREFTITAKCRGITIAGIYLPPSMKIETIRSTMNELPLIVDMVLGDLNARLGKHTRTAKAERSDLIAAWCTSKGLALKKPETEIDSSKIDHILAKPMLATSACHIIQAPIETDHPLLTITVCTSGPNEANHTARFNIHRLNCVNEAAMFLNVTEDLSLNLRHALQAFMNTAAGKQPRRAIDFLDHQLVCLVQTALKKCLGTRQPSGLYTRGGSAKPKALDMATAIRKIRSAQREGNAKCNLVSLDETLSPQEEAVRYYTAIYKRTCERPKERWSTANSSEYTPETIQSVVSTIKAYPSAKSPGIDGIDRRVLITLTRSKSLMTWLTTLYNMCIRTGITPERWNQSVITPIPKASKDPKYIYNRRPVALTVLFRRIFEKLILSKIVSAVSLNRGQAGFRTGFSCLSQVLLAEQGRHNGKNIRVFLDLKCAYDGVPIDKMIAKLANKGVDKRIVKLVESLFTNCTTVIAINGSLTKPVQLEKGLFQGSLLSPILFDVFIDDLADAINLYKENETEVPECLLYADDILLESESELQMRHLLTVTEIWCRSNEMTINVPKSGTTHTGTTFLVANEPLPQVGIYRYLGIPLSRTGIEPAGLIEENIRRATAAFALVKKSLASRLWPHATKINVYKVYIRSVLEYAAPILVLMHNLGLYKKEISRGIKKMQELQNDAVKWIFRKKRPLPTLESLAGLLTVQNRFEQLTANLRLHLMNVSQDNPLTAWTKTGRGSGITHAAAFFPIPADQKAESIEALYRERSSSRAARLNRLAGYIDPASRLENGMDACLTIQNEKARNLAINWRCNVFRPNYRCKTCNKPFTRRHVSCAQLRIRPSLAVEHARLVESRDQGGMYTILDHLLNRRKYQLFAGSRRILEANTIRGTFP
jgi:Reverse transcriptase (RNA-dependent DNA polymerase)